MFLSVVFWYLMWLWNCIILATKMPDCQQRSGRAKEQLCKGQELPHQGAHSSSFLLHYQFAVGRIRRASTKGQIRGWVIEPNIVEELKVLMEDVSDWCWGRAMEMCPEGGVMGDEYLSSFSLCSLTVWRHNIQNDETDSDSFGANLEFCFSQGKALLGYRGSFV